MKNATLAKFIVLSAIFTLALSVNYLFAAWTGPTAPPPGNNTPTPVNVGSVSQQKLGAFIAGGLRSMSDLYVDGNVGIRTLSPSTGGDRDLNLDIEGAVGAKYYCDENGNNCSSAPLGGGGGDSDWTITGNNMYSGVSGNVGIGVTSPTQKLDVAGKIKVGNDSSSPVAGTIRWTGSDFEGYTGSQWVSFTASGGGGGGGCPAGQDSVDFGGTSICLAEGATASAECLTQFVSPVDNTTVTWATSQGQARYSNGKIQTITSGDFGHPYKNCNSGWVDGNYAECTPPSYGYTDVKHTVTANNTGIILSSNGSIQDPGDMYGSTYFNFSCFKIESWK